MMSQCHMPEHDAEIIDLPVCRKMFAEGVGEYVYLVEKTNFVLQIATVGRRVNTLAELRYMAPLLFVQIYQSFYGPMLGIIAHPRTTHHNKNNMDIFLSAMRERFSVPYIDNITTSELLDGNLHPLEVVVDLLFGESQRVSAIQKEKRRKEIGPTRDDALQHNTCIRKVRDTASHLKSNKAMKQFYATQKSTSKSQKDVRVLLDRLRQLSPVARPTSASFSAPRQAKTSTAEGKKGKHVRSTRAGKESTPGSRPAITPLFKGRVPAPCTLSGAAAGKVEQQQQQLDDASDCNNIAENSMDLLYETEKQDSDNNRHPQQQQPNDTDNCNDSAADSMDRLYEDVRRKCEPVQSFPARSDAEPREEEKGLVPILSRGRLIDSAALYEKDEYHYHRPARSPSSRPLPRRPHSASCQGRRSPVGSTRRGGFAAASRESAGVAVGQADKYVYDHRTGRRLRAEELAELLQAREDACRQWQQRERRGRSAAPAAAAASREGYPSPATESSVRHFLQKMRLLRQQPPGEGEGEGAGAMRGAAAPLRSLDAYRQLSCGDLLVSVEHCCNCEHHQMSTRHRSEEYTSRAAAVLQDSAQLLRQAAPAARVGMLRFNAKVTASSRAADKHSCVGAFEVQVALRDSAGALHMELLHSKLNTARWPSKTVLHKRLRAFVLSVDVDFVTSGDCVGTSDLEYLGSTIEWIGEGDHFWSQNGDDGGGGGSGGGDGGGVSDSDSVSGGGGGGGGGDGGGVSDSDSVCGGGEIASDGERQEDEI